MPVLNWSSKSTDIPKPVEFTTDSFTYPKGSSSAGIPPVNRLILGDNLAVMSSLVEKYAGKIQVIYADPPFFSNRRYRSRIGRGEDSRQPKEWKMAEGYADNWKNIDAYLDMLYPRLKVMHRLLAPTGTFYLHLDWHANHYARLLLDEIFGTDNLLNEIVWVYHGPSPIKSAFNRKHDTILAYTKSKEYVFNVDDIREPYNPNTVKTFKSSAKAGFGKIPNLKRGKVPEDWWYFPVVARLHSERTGYPTQKPEALLKRIILASSNKGDLVADFFCGSGTTAKVAQDINRNFICSDYQWRAIHTSRKRLIVEGNQPFSIEMTGDAIVPNEERSKLFKPFQFIAPNTIQMYEEYLDEVDFWEVDPAYNGKVFNSSLHAVRPRRKGEMPTRLELDNIGEKICLRFTLASGSQYQEIIPR